MPDKIRPSWLLSYHPAPYASWIRFPLNNSNFGYFRPIYHTFLVLLLWSDLCQEEISKTFIPWISHIYYCLTASEKSHFSSLRHVATLYSWIDYQQANGPLRALLSTFVNTVSRAHIRGPQLTRTVLLPGSSQMLSDCFIVICSRNLHSTADFCLIILIIRANGCQGLSREAVRSTFDWHLSKW